MLLLSAHFTVLVLLVSGVVRFLYLQTHIVNIRCFRRYVLKSISKITSEVGLFTSVLMKD